MPMIIHTYNNPLFVYRWKGLRDDICLLIDEEMDVVNLCALHCEMRNTGQLLVNIGLAAYECGSLKECNEVLSKYGPQNFQGDRITIKLTPNQQTKVERRNIHVSSFSGMYDKKTPYANFCTNVISYFLEICLTSIVEHLKRK